MFFEGKYVEATSTTFSEGDGFYDTLFIQADNPYIPAQLQPVVAQTGGLLLTQDPWDFSDNNPSEYTRETMRFVAGFEWELSPEHVLEVSANHGEFTNTSNLTTTVLDRTFAAIDAVTDSSGNIVCRSDLNPTLLMRLTTSQVLTATQTVRIAVIVITRSHPATVSVSRSIRLAPTLQVPQRRTSLPCHSNEFLS